eukprot:gb/GECG01006290.1/.p1 GENE.gb/GECG01006290.1/~~gb/GECG01006290.1/.p1  ORF type:complete len:336 (+),score=31.99 gb/GECG01006290.1/:1-1008(+)
MTSTIRERLISRLSTGIDCIQKRLPTECKNPLVLGLASGSAAAYLAVRLWRRYRAVNIEGSLVVVTGSSQGIGAALAHLLAARGAQVVLMARNEEKIQRVALEINHKYGERATAYRVDCADPEQVRSVSEHITSVHGTPDIVVNCAGSGQWKSLFEMNVGEIWSTLDAPLLAAVFVTRAFLPGMIRRNRGQIVNVQSPASRSPIPGSTMYTTMRYALCGLSKALAADLWSTNILVQEVILGEVSSTYWKNNPGSATRLPKIANMFKSMTEEKAARGVIYGIESGDSSYVYPYTIRALFAIHGWCPTPIDKLMRYTGWRVDPSRHIALPSDEFDNL